jgi:hypothetical protein
MALPGHPAFIIYSTEEKISTGEEMYSSADSLHGSAWRVHLTVHDPDPSPASPPERLIDLVHYAGADDWLSIDLREWGHCFVDMERGEAFAVLSSTLADNPGLVCLVLSNTILTNFSTRHGYSMLHASALVKDEHILLLQAPYGTGKSTTALRLLSFVIPRHRCVVNSHDRGMARGSVIPGSALPSCTYHCPVPVL